jgi:hypothetical protein
MLAKVIAFPVESRETQDKHCPSCNRFRDAEGFKLKGTFRNATGYSYRLYICARCWDERQKALANRSKNG